MKKNMIAYSVDCFLGFICLKVVPIVKRKRMSVLRKLKNYGPQLEDSTLNWFFQASHYLKKSNAYHGLQLARACLLLTDV